MEKDPAQEASVEGQRAADAHSIPSVESHTDVDDALSEHDAFTSRVNEGSDASMSKGASATRADSGVVVHHTAFDLGNRADNAFDANMVSNRQEQMMQKCMNDLLEMQKETARQLQMLQAEREAISKSPQSSGIKMEVRATSQDSGADMPNPCGLAEEKTTTLDKVAVWSKSNTHAVSAQRINLPTYAGKEHESIEMFLEDFNNAIELLADSGCEEWHNDDFVIRRLMLQLSGVPKEFMSYTLKRMKHEQKQWTWKEALEALGNKFATNRSRRLKKLDLYNTHQLDNEGVDAFAYRLASKIIHVSPALEEEERVNLLLNGLKDALARKVIYLTTPMKNPTYEEVLEISAAVELEETRSKLPSRSRVINRAVEDSWEDELDYLCRVRQNDASDGVESKRLRCWLCGEEHRMSDCKALPVIQGVLRKYTLSEVTQCLGKLDDKSVSSQHLNAKRGSTSQ